HCINKMVQKPEIYSCRLRFLELSQMNTYCEKQSLCSNHRKDKGHTLLKAVLKYAVEVANHGVKKERAVHDKDPFVPHIGSEEEVCLVQHHVAIAINYRKKCVV